MAEEVLEIHQETTEIEKAAALFQIYQEIDVTPFIGVASRDGSEDADVTGSTAGGDAEDLVSAGSQFLDSHAILSFSLIRANLSRPW